MTGWPESEAVSTAQWVTGSVGDAPLHSSAVTGLLGNVSGSGLTCTGLIIEATSDYTWILAMFSHAQHCQSINHV